MKVWIRERVADCSTSPTRSISTGSQRPSAAITGPRTSRAISFTARASSSDATGKPTSITSTPRAASWRASRSFCSVFIEKPGACSPSRRVVSKMISWSVSMERSG